METPLNLKLPGVIEMGKTEMQQTNGGWIRLVCIYLANLAAELVYEGIDKCVEDLKDGFNTGYNN